MALRRLPGAWITSFLARTLLVWPALLSGGVATWLRYDYNGDAVAETAYKRIPVRSALRKRLLGSRRSPVAVWSVTHALQFEYASIRVFLTPLVTIPQRPGNRRQKRNTADVVLDHCRRPLTCPL